MTSPAELTPPGRPLLTAVPDAPHIPPADRAVLQAVADEIAARRPDVVRTDQSTRRLADASRLDRAVKAVTDVGATVSDVREVLALLGSIESDAIAGTSDPKLRQPLALGRYQGLCWFLARKLDELA